MTDLTRRETLAESALGALVAAMPAWAQDKTMPADTAQWDLTDLYPSDAAWDEARKQPLAALPGMKKYQGPLGTSADALVRALVHQSDLCRNIARIYVYLSLKADAALHDAANQAKQAQARDLNHPSLEEGDW